MEGGGGDRGSPEHTPGLIGYLFRNLAGTATEKIIFSLLVSLDSRLTDENGHLP